MIHNHTIGYLLSYAIQGMYGLMLGTYLPVYISDFLHINPTHIVLLTLIAYLPVVLKPLLGMAFDALGSFQKLFIIAGCVLFIGSSLGSFFIDASANINGFAIFIFLSFLGLTIIDVNFDTIMVNTLRETDTRVKNIALIMIANQFGGLLSVLIVNLTSGVLAYTILFLVSAIITIGLLVVSMGLSKNLNDSIRADDIAQDREKTMFPQNIPKITMSKIYLFGILFALFLNGDRMSDWILEPYINGMGSGLFDVYSSWLQLFIVFSIVGYLVALAVRDKQDPYSRKSQKILMYLLSIFVVYWILFPLVNFTGILVLQAIIFFLGGIAYILFLDIFMFVSQIGRSRFGGTIYQIFLALFQIGLWISVPFGIWLASVIPIKIVFMFCAAPCLLSVASLSLMGANIKSIKGVGSL